MLIAFTGRKGSGKDTAAAVFESAGFTNIKMADGLKYMLRALLGLKGADEETIERMIEGDLKEVPSHLLLGQTPRYAMQTLGTEWGRNKMGEGFWVNTFRDIVKSIHPAPVVCTDVRFPNEVAMIKDMGGAVYRIERAGVSKADCHVSEALIDELDVDGVLMNDATTVEEFQAQVATMFSRLNAPIQ